MSRALRHLALFGMSLPSALLGYHVLAGGAGDLASAEGTSQRLADLVATAGGQHSLAELALLERNLYYVEQRYVDQDRVDFDAMFSGSLERVERSVAGVMFVRQPSGKRLQVSIGTYDTVLFVETLDDFDALIAHLAHVHPSRYIGLVEGLRGLGLRGVRVLTDQNDALRFVALVDRLYDAQVALRASGTSLDLVFSEEMLGGGYRKKYLRAISRLVALANE